MLDFTKILTERTLLIVRDYHDILKQLMTLGHELDPGEAFQVILRNSNPRFLAFLGGGFGDQQSEATTVCKNP